MALPNKRDAEEKSWFDEQMEDLEFRLGFAQEMVSFDFCDQLEDEISAQGMTRAQLAAKLGRSRSYVTQALRRGRNLTIRTMVELTHALGLEVKVTLSQSNCRKDSRPTSMGKS